MAGFYVAQGGSTLYQMSTAGVSGALTLPTGITLDSAGRLRGASLGGQVILVGSPSENLAADPDGNVRRLALRPPASPVSLGDGNAGSLSGTFIVWVTYKLKDAIGNLLSESDFGPASAAATIASKLLRASNVPPTNESLPTNLFFSRQLYRSTTGGTTKFPWVELDGNTVTSVEDDLSDASLGLVAAPDDLGSAPKFDLITEWKDRLWGKAKDDIDTLYQSGVGKPYAYPADRLIPIPPRNADPVGISGFLRRKDALGVGRQDALHKIVGTNQDNFTRQVESDRIGIWAADSCITVDDIGYFLGNPFGIYSWGPSGISNLTNARVKAWFETDTYFNRSQFDKAVAMYDPTSHSIIVFLSAVGSTDLDRWIQLDIATGAWWGPHLTSAFTPQGGVLLRDSNNIAIPVWLGSDGKLYKPTTTKTDGTSTGIALDATTNWFSGGSPDIHKTWLNPSIISKIQGSGTLTIAPTVGELDASAGAAISHAMTVGRRFLRIIGDGRFMRVRFTNSTNAEDVVIYGWEQPFIENGRR